ncbi:hypothetical protein ACHAXT_002797 [Thalassiosira profunda]
MGGKRDKKKKAKDPLKKAALAAKKEAKADKAALKRLQREQDRLSSLSVHDDDHDDGADGRGKKGGKGKSAPDDLDALLESYKNQTRELTAVELEAIATPFPCPPRGNFTWTLCPSNGMFYMFGGEYYDGAENLVFDELLRWDPDAKPQLDKDDDDESGGAESNTTGQWTRILTPAPRPPPRCAHSTVYHNDSLYVFGGECATADQYHHYRDLWRFDIKQNTWEECRARGGTPPPARSGHRAVVWRHYMILFGGFHEALRTETRWFNDVHIFDFQTSTWTELKYGKLARLPPPRSACNMSICTSPTEALFVCGGYSKVKNANAPGASRSEGIMHIDCWMLPLKSLVGGGKGGPLNGANPPSWERITRKGEYPSARAGTSAVLHKNKMLVYGGVLDHEGDHHKLDSVFYDDLFALDMERRRWFAMRLKKAAAGRRRRRKKDGDAAAEEAFEAEEDEGVESDDDVDEDEATTNEEAKSSGWDLDQLRHDMFAFIDGDGNVVFEKIEEEENEGEGKQRDNGKEDDEEMTATTKQTDGSEGTDATGDGSGAGMAENEPQQTKPSAPPKAAPQAQAPKPSEKIAASSVMKVDDSGMPTAVARQTPLPRINCASVVRNNTLYIYGGVLEVGDREVTLDDCWSIDLNKRDKWTCIWPGQMHRQVWKGVDSDNDSYISSDQAGDDDDESDDGMAEFEPILEGEPDEEESEEARKKAKKAAKKAKEKEKRRGIRHEIAELKEKLGVDDEQRTPLMGESVADFYARTTEYWNVEAANSVGKAAADRGDALSAKELKREGFHLAQARYEELAPILDRLNELEAAQAESEEKRAKKKAEKKPKKDRMR